MVDRPDAAMVVTPHPDDAEIGCGGTVAKWIGEGTRVVYVLCTNGDKGTGDRDMTSERLAALREEEQAQAAAELGVKEVVYLRHPDGGLEDSAEFREQLVRAIRAHRPDTVFCPDPFRQSFYLHRDHRICGQVTLDAVFPFARDHLHFPDHLQVDGLEPHKVGEILMWGTEAPDTFVDIAETLDIKIAALLKHATQVAGAGSDSDVKEFVKANASRMGQRAEMPYAEAFRAIQYRR